MVCDRILHPGQHKTTTENGTALIGFFHVVPGVLMNGGSWQSRGTGKQMATTRSQRLSSRYKLIATHRSSRRRYGIIHGDDGAVVDVDGQA